MLRFVAERSGGSSRRIADIVSAADSRWNARPPDSISYKIAPKEKMSDRPSAGLPFTCSGDMYPSVPMTTPGSVPAAVGRLVCAPEAASLCVSLARPKSRIFTRPSDVRKTFSGFRSR
jgi:hypothetical protein